MDLELVLCHIPVLHAFELFLGTGITKQTVVIYPLATELTVRLLLCLKKNNQFYSFSFQTRVYKILDHISYSGLIKLARTIPFRMLLVPSAFQ